MKLEVIDTKTKKKYEIELLNELCCDYCNEIIHSHFDCPVCKYENAGTSIYGGFDEIDDEFSNPFKCEECKSEFLVVAIS